MAIFTILSVVIWFSTSTLEFFATLVSVITMCMGNMRYTGYNDNVQTMNFHTVLLFVLYTIVNFTTQCGKTAIQI